MPFPLRAALLSLCFFVTLAAPAFADGVAYRATGCGDYIFVSGQNGYSVLLASGGHSVKDRDVLTGNVDRIGTPHIFDQTTGQSVFAQVTEQNLTQPEVARRIAQHCRAALRETLVNGYVSRASGCGNRIYVNTPQGYAVLERISGGIVADGDSLTGNFNRPGRATVQDQQSGSSLVVFVHDIWLSKSAAEREMTARCRR